ncbi:MAG TPA: DUF4342 domain-containing protein [Firmicutes bacterium]|nr:DUF4342 domain-containing protein [Bacillota bacterium]
MEQAERLKKVDQIRERTGVSYSEAAELLDKAGGDVLQAVIMHEKARAKGPAQWLDWEDKGEEVLEKIKALIRQGNVTKIVVKKDGRSMAEIPVTAGVIGAIIAPTLALVSAAVCLLGRCSIEIERRGQPDARFEVVSGEIVENFDNRGM